MKFLNIYISNIKINTLIVTISCLTMFSCNDIKNIKENFYPNGAVKLKSYYRSKKDSIPYLIVKYFEDGKTEDSTYYNDLGNKEGYSYSDVRDKEYRRELNYKNGIIDGVCKAFIYGGGCLIQHYKNGKWHGINYTYDEYNRLFKRSLYVNGKPLIMETTDFLKKGDTVEIERTTRTGISTFKQIVDCDSLKLKQYYDISNEGFEFISSLSYKNYDTIENNTKDNAYAEMFCNDTIQNGDNLKVTIIGHYGNFEKTDTYLKVIVGNLIPDSDLVFDKDAKVLNSKLNNHKVNLEINNYHKGYNLLLAKVMLMRDTSVIQESLIYDDYVVVDNFLKNN